MSKDVVQEDVTLKDMRDYLKSFNKKFKSFQSRSPLIFTYITSPFKVMVHVSGKEVVSFNIDYTMKVEDFISVIRKYFRNRLYPKMIKSELKRVDPRVEDINRITAKKDISFDDAFKELSYKQVEYPFIIDKIDIMKNRIVLLDETSTPRLYQASIPVYALLKKITGQSDYKKRYEIFRKHSTHLERKD